MSSSITLADSLDIDFSDVIDEGAPRLPPTHPGTVLREEFLEPLEMSANALARELRVPPNRITAILAGKRSVTAETALRLSAFFETSAEFWINLQTRHDLEDAWDDLADELSMIATLSSARGRLSRNRGTRRRGPAQT